MGAEHEDNIGPELVQNTLVALDCQLTASH